MKSNLPIIIIIIGILTAIESAFSQTNKIAVVVNTFQKQNKLKIEVRW